MEEDPLSICYCGWGYNRPMIRCCHCKHWYHYDWYVRVLNFIVLFPCELFWDITCLFLNFPFSNRYHLEQNIFDEGDKVTLDLGLGNIHPEIKKLIGKLRYRASYGQNALAHSLEVANLAGIIAAELGGDCMLATRAGLLHDIGKARTHDFKGTHVELGAEIARRYNEPAVVLNAILSHHGNEEVKSVEAAAVCAADALSAARPGARREVLENYLRRVSEIEIIAMSKMGVLHAYVINSGREVRAIVKSEDISDDESYLLAKEIAKDIEAQVQYPGEVKVSVIRETRACAVAG